MDNKKKQLPNGWFYFGATKDIEMKEVIFCQNDSDEISEDLIDEYIEVYEELYDRTLHGEFFYPDDEDDFENDIIEIIS